MNTPYVKQLDAFGRVKNPITKANPYINYFPNRSQRRAEVRELAKKAKRGISRYAKYADVAVSKSVIDRRKKTSLLGKVIGYFVRLFNRKTA